MSGNVFTGPGSGGSVTGYTPPSLTALASIAPASGAYLTFVGVGFSSGRQRQFQALSGSKPPTITGGYAKWKPIPRPLARAMTVFDGYDPTQMTVEVIFGSWANGGWGTSNQAGQTVEANIAVLEWMAGSNFQTGPSPVVYVTCPSPSGGQSDLIPPQYQTRPGSPFPWIITALEWGTAYRNAAGFRIWQQATVTLQNFLNVNATPRADTTAHGAYFVSRAGRDRPLLIASAPSVSSPTADVQILAGRICSDSHNNPCKDRPNLNLNGKGLRFVIPHGVQVWVPSHQTA